MARMIKITPDLMRTRASEYTKEAANIHETIKKMDNLLKTLQSEWEGASAKAYSQRFADLRPDFLKTKDLIDEIAKSLNETARVVEETDNSIAAQFKL